MEMKLNVRNIDLRDTQENLEDTVKLAKDFGRKTARVYAGMIDLALTSTRSLVERSKSLVDEAEERGEALEEAAQKRAEDVLQDARSSVQKATRRLDESREGIQSKLQRSERRAEKELEAQVAGILERMGIPTRERINRLSAEIESLSHKIDQLAAMQNPVVGEPVPGYDEMTAKEILAKLDSYSPTQLAAIQSYETAHQGRITVLRDVEKRLREV